MMQKYKRGDMIWIKESNREIGCEQRGERPAIVIQNNLGNKHSSNLIVAKMSARSLKKRTLPTHVLVEGYDRKSIVMCEMLETISKDRIDSTKKKTALKPHEIELVNEALKISLAL